MRYAGQNYELAVPLPDGPVTTATLDRLARGFADIHQRLYGFIAEGEPVQVVTFRTEATGLVSKATLKAHPLAGGDASGAVRERREVWLAEVPGYVACPVYDRENSRGRQPFRRPGDRRADGCNHRRAPGHVGRVDPYLNLILEAT